MAETPIHEKKFALHTDERAYYPDQRGLESIWRASREVETAVEGTPKDLIPKMPVTMPYNRVPAKWNNPIALYYLVDTLVRAQRGTYLRPSYICDELNKNVPHLFWKPISVGRMLGAIRMTCADKYNPGRLGDEPEYALPFDRGRDSRGTFYVIDPIGGYEGALWLVKVRAWAAEEARRVMFTEAQGDFTQSIWGAEQGFTLPHDFYTAFFPNAVRSPEMYLAAADDRVWGGQRESRTAPIRSVFGA